MEVSDDGILFLALLFGSGLLDLYDLDLVYITHFLDSLFLRKSIFNPKRRDTIKLKFKVWVLVGWKSQQWDHELYPLREEIRVGK
ncbi:hypothetical protein POJ06DRAFT_69368 [Lipomyces tetrasporus]|uniref:Uncharacterized protein n=1 Tax=Lipomyces tetrasporus TaxID=54092 RepID=A0AAD7QUI5_9ASCO|nr:uncharacterized protein POJ06DRAFT_69368 [Lipomyces tetrasporus]KAJ8101689.1 hypothetical protein POJ06DRAFT_69368 [Lipomyces tetrasporus]